MISAEELQITGIPAVCSIKISASPCLCCSVPAVIHKRRSGQFYCSHILVFSLRDQLIYETSGFCIIHRNQFQTKHISPSYGNSQYSAKMRFLHIFLLTGMRAVIYFVRYKEFFFFCIIALSLLLKVLPTWRSGVFGENTYFLSVEL